MFCRQNEALLSQRALKIWKNISYLYCYITPLYKKDDKIQQKQQGRKMLTPLRFKNLPITHPSEPSTIPRQSCTFYGACSCIAFP